MWATPGAAPLPIVEVVRLPLVGVTGCDPRAGTTRAMGTSLIERGLDMNATLKGLRATVDLINARAIELGLLEGDKWVDGIPWHLVESPYEMPHLYLEEGTQTYGRAWRLVGIGGSKYQTGHYDVFRLGDGYLGWTKNEAQLSLRAIMSTLDRIIDVRRERGDS